MAYHEKRFPNEPDGYRAARDELLAEEIELRGRIEEIARKRRELPLGGKVKEDYAFERQTNGRKEEVRLSQLFRDGRDSLLIYDFMFAPGAESACPMCTSLLDSLDRTAPHAEQRVNLAVVAKATIERIQAHAEARSWGRLQLLSSLNNSFGKDYFAENEDGEQIPGLNVFVRRSDGIFHFYSPELFFVPQDGHPRGLDAIWPLWNLFDLTPEGRGSDWFPQLAY